MELAGTLRIPICAWGPAAWLFLESIALSYPDQPSLAQQQAMRTFYDSLSDVLPCRSCAEHLRQYLSRVPVDVRSHADLFRWLCGVHNHVRRRQGKTLLTDADRHRFYTTLCRRHSMPPVAVFATVVGVLVVLTLVGVTTIALAR